MPLADKVETAFSSIDVKQLSSEFLRDIINDITSRLQSLEYSESLKASRNENVPEDSKSPSVSDLTTKQELRVDALAGSLPVVNYCNWEKFKNCFSKDEVCPAIDALALQHGEDLDEQIEEEQMRRLVLPPDASDDYRDSFERERMRRNHIRNDKGDETLRLERVRIKSRQVLEFLARVTGETFLPEKSYTFLKPFKFLIHHHQKLEDEFRILQEKLQASSETNSEMHLSTSPNSATLTPGQATAGEAKAAHQPAKNQTESTLAQDSSTTDMQEARGDDVFGPCIATGPESDATDVQLLDNESADLEQADTTSSRTPVERDYEHIKCYMDFARAHLIPTYRKFENLDHVGNPKIRYEDLWSLFRPGELVFQREDEPESANNNAESHRSTPQSRKGPRVWRVDYISSEGVDWHVRSLHWPEDLRGRSSSRKDLEPVDIDAYRLDFTGEQYEPVIWNFPFIRWEGEKTITSLPIFPVRFHKDASKILEECRRLGERFQHLLMQGHLPMEHNGWTLSRNPVGDLIRNSWEDDEQRPVYVSSDVIIDHQEALQSNPWWTPGFLTHKVEQDTMTTAPPLTNRYDRFPILVWSDVNRTRSLGQMSEIVIHFDNIEQAQHRALAQTDDFIVDSGARKFEKNTASKKLSPDDLALLPNRLFVYSLRDRMFVNANIDCLKEIKPIADPWQELKIPPHNLKLIRNTVDDHFAKKRLQRELHGMGLESLEQDFIRSKGRGLVFLLHGPPGVGKTATAEAVAYAHRKPLFSLACFDLGVDPGTVEARLSEVFRLANMWDCVLLLDEADIFLSHREKKDDNLQRNAIVSTFLRTMEYYPGILFLTTNRPGALDEALSSRVHISLAFENLNLDQTLDIFEMNIKRCKLIADQRATLPDQPDLIIEEEDILDFAAEEFDRCKPAPFWNGRVIRNSFQIAMSLAYVEKARGASAIEKTTTDARPVKYLRRKHFKDVLTIFQDFKNYREVMFNKSDERLAHERGERASMSSLSAAKNRESNHGRDGMYGTPTHSHRMARSPNPPYRQSYSDRRTGDRRDDYGVRRRYDPDNDGDDRPRNSRVRSDRESDSEYRRQPARDRDRDRDDRPRSRQDDDNTSRKKARDDQAGLEIPADHRSRSSRSLRDETNAARGQRSKTPSPPPRRKGDEEEDSDEHYRRRGHT
ncbi:hypothetical protein QBC37DRAFT_296483 [Rhypophila decipiens]|uniref:AAA+ ATPase domain-containing protein n=1 Tax=Rhypophila decipiens TaxID=261697 RepID=A0AAN7B359_9PEZI|nr:hypothetical protein QBC37DRAFT_296483 [Rhypophila decipiens]